MALGILSVIFISGGEQKLISHQYSLVIRARTDWKMKLIEYFCYRVIVVLRLSSLWLFVLFCCLWERKDQAAGPAFIYYARI